MKAYLAGPDVFLPNAAQHAAEKIRICAIYGLTGLAPLEDQNQISTGSTTDVWRAIFRKDIEMMEDCDIIIANLTPFRGASADAGTLVELGWFLGRGKPIFGYSNSAASFTARSLAQIAAMPDGLPGLVVENFGLTDNLMVPGALEFGGGLPVMLPPDGKDRAFDALDVFEACVAGIVRQTRTAKFKSAF
ncbi:MAG: nucleoside 2-deoxyribosyltransferase [Acidocella sp.]|nr:nucleoside 2-deoxyribosyltransferase [Acidocella sp.]